MNAVSVTFPRWEPFIIVLMLLSAASALAAQTPPPRDVRLPTQPTPTRDRVSPKTTGTAAIRGRVVDGVTGSPIARARVRILGGPSPRGSVQTDGEGIFKFTGLPAGSFTLMAEKATYLPGRYPDVGRTLRARVAENTIADGQIADVTIRMFHGAAITGRVVDSYGDPLDFADVRVMALQRGRPPMMRSGGSTNDLGEFRIARLEPGRYVLSVTPRNMGGGDDTPPGVPVNVYAQPMPVFYPGAASPEQAQAIVVNRGETIAGIEIVLGEGIPTVITGVVSGPDGVLAKVNGSIAARVASSGPQQGPPMATTSIRPDGAFRLQLPPGQYLLEARAYPQVGANEPYQQSRELFGLMAITVGGSPTESVMMLVGKGATASGRFVFEGTTPPPAAPVGKPTRPPLGFDESNNCRTGEATIAADWTFKIDGLIGMCSAPMSNVFGRWAVKSIKVGGVDALETPVTFEAGRHYSDVEILVTDKPSHIELDVAGDDGQPTREYVALAYPLDKAMWARGARAIRTLVPRATNGPRPTIPSGATVQPRDRFSGLLPGEYYVITLDDIDAEDVFDPSVLEKLAVHAARVSVLPEGGIIELSLRRIKAQEILR